MSATRLIALGLMGVGLTCSLLPSNADAWCRRARRGCCYTYTNYCYNPCVTTCGVVSTGCNTGCGTGCAPSTTVQYGQYQEFQGQTTIQGQPSFQGQPSMQGGMDASGSPSNQTFQGAPPAPAPRTDENRDRGPNPIQPPPSGNPAENRPST